MSPLDCIVCGEACVDLIVGPLPLDRPLVEFGLLRIESIRLTTGGITPNAGIALARLGLNVAALSIVGADHWGDVIRQRLVAEQVDVQHLISLAAVATSATAVLLGDDGEHVFAFHAGASQTIDRRTCLDRLDLFAQARMALFGYYNLLPHLEPDLPEVLQAVRKTGCRTALDATNGGGSLQPLDRILRHLDIYIPSLAEAQQQTGETDPEAMLRVFRACGTDALLGIKLGDRGVLLSPEQNTLLAVPPVQPPGPVVDTTGAGDSFYAGLIAGLLRGMTLERAARLGAAAGACCVTGRGATAALRDFDATCALIASDR